MRYDDEAEAEAEADDDDEDEGPRGPSLGFWLAFAVFCVGAFLAVFVILSELVRYVTGDL